MLLYKIMNFYFVTIAQVQVHKIIKLENETYGTQLQVDVTNIWIVY